MTPPTRPNDTDKNVAPAPYDMKLGHPDIVDQWNKGTELRLSEARTQVEGESARSGAERSEPGARGEGRIHPISSPEICLCAAIQLGDGRIVLGHRHSDCFRTILEWTEAGQHIGRLLSEQQGFLTSNNRFVDRYEGAQLMREANHISTYTGALFRGDVLFSEDLY